ncbi:MAG: DUF4198 domain-containing protein [Paracoccaceae bacterium]|nr:DUF4198 domain-containing protein [Paracoccaceae bacterium]
MRALITALALCLAAPVAAHEFWIDPTAYVVDPSAPLVAEIRVGENFKGSAYGYVPPNFRRFDLVMGRSVLPVEGRAGDRPALNMAVKGEGLVTVVHVTRDLNLRYTDWQKFINFTTHKDFTWALEQHLDRGLPQTGFRERYSRHGKSLMAVGDGKGRDKKVGLLTEIVALANPYTDDMARGFPVQVLYENKPRRDVQVELFERAPNGSVDVTLHRTDNRGRVTLPVKPGHAYLVDAVVMRPLEAKTENDPVWESLWASLTFEVPR